MSGTFNFCCQNPHKHFSGTLHHKRWRPCNKRPLRGLPSRRPTATVIPTQYLPELLQVNVADSQVVTDLLHTKGSETAQVSTPRLLCDWNDRHLDSHCPAKRTFDTALQVVSPRLNTFNSTK